MTKTERTAVEAVARRFSGTWAEGTGHVDAILKIGRKRISVSITTIGEAKEPRLRFDKVAVGLIERLRAGLSDFVPKGKTVVVTTTAPIWQDSKTGVALEGKIRELLAARRTGLKTTLNGNRIRVRVLRGGAIETPKLVGFVHNPSPDPAILFELTWTLLTRIGSGRARSISAKNDRWLVIASEEMLAPLGIVRHICSALRTHETFKKVFVVLPDGSFAPLIG